MAVARAGVKRAICSWIPRKLRVGAPLDRVQKRAGCHDGGEVAFRRIERPHQRARLSGEARVEVAHKGTVEIACPLRADRAREPGLDRADRGIAGHDDESGLGSHAHTSSANCARGEL